MGCGCSGGNVSSAQYSTPSNNIHSQIVIDDSCPYTLDMINSWLNKARCFKDNAYYQTMPNITLAMVNGYIGTLMSALNYPTNICYFKNMLDEVDGFITLVISTGLC